MRDNKKNYLKRGEREERRRIRNNIKEVRNNKIFFFLNTIFFFFWLKGNIIQLGQNG